jgi:hypothetical protein
VWWPFLRRAGLLLGALLFLWQLWSALQAVAQSNLSGETAARLALGLGPVAIATALQILAWRVLMAAAGVRLSWSEALTSYMLPFVARYIPGAIWGYVSRTQWLEHHHHVPAALTNRVALQEVASLLVTGAALTVGAGVLSGVPMLAAAGTLGLVSFVGGIALISYLSAQSWWKAKVFDRWQLGGWVAQLSLTSTLAASGWHVGVWVGYGLALGWAISALGGTWTLNDPLLLTGVFALAWTVGFVVLFLPAGLGLRDLSLTLLLIDLMHLPPGQAAIAAVAMRVFLLASELIYLVCAIGVERDRRSQIKSFDGRSGS